MKKSILSIALMVIAGMLYSQPITQTVRGQILDIDSKTPLIGVSVIIQGSNPIKGATTDLGGNFRLEQVPLGRISLQLSYLGYESAVIPNIVINSGKEAVLNLNMEESTTKLNNVVITATKNKGEALNDMVIVSGQSISPEETNRYAGGFNDPAVILSNFAGVTNTQDGSNDLIVRGNSPKYVQWRLEGIQITNPNHFADQSAVGGAISTLNNNILSTSDFYTGAFAPEYGDVLSGVYDVKIRQGNNEKFESVFGFGILGTDFTIEGPFKKGYKGSYLANYRYSTASVISDLGLLDIGGIPVFQDGAFKIVLPTEKSGTFSLFGLGGMSKFLFDDITPALIETPGDRSLISEIQEDYDKKSHLLNLGLKHTLPINGRSFLSTTLAFSSEGIEDKIYESSVTKIFDSNGVFQKDSTSNRTLNFNSKLVKSISRNAITYHHKLSSRSKFQIGTKYTVFNYTFTQSQFKTAPEDRFALVDFNESIGTIRNFISWKQRVSSDITIVGGFHNMNVFFNNKHTLEPRISLNWNLSNTSSFHAGYGKHSNMESVHSYFTRVEQADGSITEPNRDLDLLKAHHYVIGFKKRLNKNLMAKVEFYYQDLYNLPIENSDTSIFSTINEGLEFRHVDLVNRGTGRNYGIELSLEKFFSHNFYYLINGSVYESKYKTLEGRERNTQYNGKYLINILAGKEFTGLGRKRNQVLGLNAKIFFGGGKRIIPLLRDDQGNLDIDASNNRFWDYEKAYDSAIEDVYKVVISTSYKWNRPRATHELYLNLDNVTNTQGRISEFYDEGEPNNIGHLKQFGLFPNLLYRIYF